MIHTTINIHPELYDQLFTECMDKAEVTETELVAIIMKLVSQEMSQRERPKRAVEYQKGPEDKKWKIVHLYLTEDEYDHFVDMRNFFKMSVAHMVALGLKKYFHQILSQQWDDKTLFPGYGFVQKTVSGVQYFAICWGKLTKYPDMNNFIPS